MNSITASPDIIKIGVWLHQQDYFKGRIGLMALWILLSLISCFLQIYCVLQIYNLSGRLNRAYFSINPDLESKKFLDCEIPIFSRIFNYVVNAKYVGQMYSDILIYQKSNTVGKIFLQFQMFLKSMVLFISLSFLLGFTQFSDSLINMVSLMVINEFDQYVGQIFMWHITTFHREINKSEKWLVFDHLEQKHYEVAYWNCIAELFLFTFTDVINFINNKYLTCQDYESFFKWKYQDFTEYDPSVIYIVLNFLVQVTKYVVIPFILFSFATIWMLSWIKKPNKQKYQPKEEKKIVKKSDDIIIIEDISNDNGEETQKIASKNEIELEPPQQQDYHFQNFSLQNGHSVNVKIKLKQGV